ncbi:MAG: hypothetical protein K2F78_05690 [Muribaculaceae bacterium]|nr:hypothetical protein [Muribaculaceae bacterium]
MKRPFLIILLLTTLSAAKPETTRLPIEKVPFSEDALSKNVWDGSRQSTINDRVSVDISMFENGLIRESVEGRTELYLLRNDSVYWRGFNQGRKIGGLLDSTVLYATLPLTETDTRIVSYNASANLSGRHYFNQTGKYTSEYIGAGTFIATSCDSIPAILIREKRCSTRFYAGNDSIKTDSLHVVFYRWYEKSSLIPFALQVTSEDGSSRLFTADDFQLDKASVDAYPDKEMRQAILDSSAISIGAGSVNVILNGVTGVDAEVFLVDIPGNIYGKTHKALEFGQNIFSISTTGLASGNYMIIIIVDGEPPLTKKEVLRL